MYLNDLQSIFLYMGVIGCSFLLFYLISFVCKPNAVSPLSVKLRMGIYVGKFSLPNLCSLVYCIPMLPWCYIYANRALTVGTDTIFYYWHYIEQNDKMYNFEPGYLALVHISNAMKLNWITFQFICCFFMMLCLIAGLMYFSDNSWKFISAGAVMYYLAYFNISTNMLRQMIAVMIGFYAIKYLVQEKLFTYFFLVLLAGAIHKSAFVLIVFAIVLIFDEKILSKQKWFYAFLCVSMVAVPFTISKIAPLMGYEYNLALSSIGLGFVKDYILLFVFIFYATYTGMIEQDKTIRIISNYTLLALPLRIMGYAEPVFARLAEYFNVMQIILFLLIIKNIKSKKNKIPFEILTSLWYIYSFYISIHYNYSDVLPYGFFAI